MIALISNYFKHLTSQISDGWDSFWFQKRDPMSLAWLRVATGLIVLLMFISMTSTLTEFYSDSGYLRLEKVKQLGEGGFRFSYLDLIQSTNQLYIAHTVAIGIALLFILGLFTRITSVLTLVICLSYWHRAPMITSEAEPVLSFTLLYLCIANCGGTFSIDRFLSLKRSMQALITGKTEEESIETLPSDYATNIAVRLLQIHIIVLYLMMAVAKLSGNGEAYPWMIGNASWWLIARTETTPIDLTAIHAYPFVFEIWTHAIVWFQFAYCFLIWKKTIRPIIVALSVPMWISIYLLTGNWVWALTMIALNFAFIESASIRTFLKTLIGEEKIKVMFDGQCNMCKASVSTIKALDVNDTIQPVDFTATEPSEHHQDLTFDKCMEQMYSIEEDGRLSGGYDALVRIARKLPGFWGFAILTYLPGTSAIGHSIYPKIAERRFRNVQCDEDGTCKLHADALAKK